MKQYHQEGWRLTDCCGAASKFFGCDRGKSCKKCGKPVPTGQGDGSEWRDKATHLQYEIEGAERRLNHLKAKLEAEVSAATPVQEPWE